MPEYMQIGVTTAVINRLKKEGFYPDNMFSVLLAMKAMYVNDTDVLNCMDDSHSSKRAVLVYYELVKRGIWEEAVDGKLIFQFTAKGRSLIEELIELGESSPKKPAHSPVEDWIGEWMNLWPKGLKSGGKLVRSDAKSCLSKMKKFVKDYPDYTKDIIFSATEKYLNEQELRGWSYTKCAVYFIHKQGEGSELASRCELMKDLSEKNNQETAVPSPSYFI